ncbi:hypothetical protein [Sphingomonas alba]|uniref:PAS domain-containing protein n=1 Tax=Sphingomonas alba TaxID=2908208 RepID=A0ABT0RMZ6_9SPHN|nr:hypothetical protein [Sphingomonas alba]MCL6683965.1 hypothetical protein [Sphingomonas alba]
MPDSLIARDMFLSEASGRFALGHVFRTSQEVEGASGAIADDIGRWRCDIIEGDQLTWSKKVYELFGLPAGKPVVREQAVRCYKEHSKSVLDRLRNDAIRHKCAFILDAAIEVTGKGTKWIRVLAVPILQGDRVIGLHGLKRAL